MEAKGNRYQKWSHVELLRAITLEKESYKPEIIELISAELERRNLPDTQRNALLIEIGRKSEEKSRSLSGIKGFLLVFIILLFIYSLFYLGIYVSFFSSDWALSDIYWDIPFIAFPAYGIYTFILLIRKNSKAPRYAKKWFAVNLVLWIILGFFYYSEYKEIVAPLIITSPSIVALIYFARSKRVAATYRRRPEEELKGIEKTLKRNPYNSKIWYNKGILLAELGRSNEALVAYEKALAIEPEAVDAWYNRADLLGELGRPDEAIGAFGKAIEIDPNDAESWYRRAHYYSIQGEKMLALSDLKRAIELNPSYKESLSKDKAFQIFWDDEDFEKLLV